MNFYFFSLNSARTGGDLSISGVDPKLKNGNVLQDCMVNLMYCNVSLVKLKNEYHIKVVAK